MGRLRPILLQMFGDSNMGYTDFPDICSYLRARTLPDFARTSWLLCLWFPAGNHKHNTQCPLADKRHNNSTSEGCFSCFVAFKLHLSSVVNANIDRSINSQHWPTNKWVGLWLQMFGSESLMTVYCISVLKMILLRMILLTLFSENMRDICTMPMQLYLH